MRSIFVTVIIAIALITDASAKNLANVDKGGAGLKGHDPVGYFTDNKVVKGDP